MEKIFNDIENDGDNGQETPLETKTDMPLEQENKGSSKPENPKTEGDVNSEEKIKSESSENSPKSEGAFNKTANISAVTPFNSPHNDPSAPISLQLLCMICDVLRKKGVPDSHIIPVLLTLITMNSAHFGYPLAICITEDEGSGAVYLVDVCMSLTPAGSRIEVSCMNQNTLFYGGNIYTGKSIIGPDTAFPKRIIDNLASLIERSSVKNQQPYKTKNSRGIEELQVVGPTAWVTIVKDKDSEILSISCILPIHLTSDKKVKQQNLLSMAKKKSAADQDRLIIDSAYIVKQFERAKSCEVEIPFAEQIANALDPEVPNIKEKIKMIYHMLIIITILNNVPPFNQSEAMAEYLGVDPSVMAGELLRNKRPEQKFLPYNTNHQIGDGANRDQVIIPGRTVLTATKVEYFVTWLLMDGLISSGDESLTERQLRVFEAILKENLEYVNGSTFTDTKTADEEEIKDTIHNEETVIRWPGRDRILEKVNADGNGKITLSTLDIELQRLLGKKFITRQKKQQSKNKYVYGVSVLSADSSIRLPHPSTIIDPEFEGRTIQVVNPVTGKMETI